jgi:hypothetical protein
LTIYNQIKRYGEKMEETSDGRDKCGREDPILAAKEVPLCGVCDTLPENRRKPTELPTEFSVSNNYRQK